MMSICAITLQMQSGSIDFDRSAAKSWFMVPCVLGWLKKPSFLARKTQNEVVIDLNMVGHVTN